MKLRLMTKALLRRIFIILVATAVLTGVTLALSIASTPTYQTSAVLLINPGSDPQVDPYTSMLTSQRLASTYVEQISMSVILDPVIHTLKLPFNAAELAGMLTVEQVRDTQLIRLTVEDTSPVRARAIANEIAAEFVRQNDRRDQARFQSGLNELVKETADVRDNIDKIGTALLMLNDPADRGVATSSINSPESVSAERARLQMELSLSQSQYAALLKSEQDFSMAAKRYANLVTILSPAELPQSPSSPRTTLNTFLGLMSGLVLGISLAFLLEYLAGASRPAAQIAKAPLRIAK